LQHFELERLVDYANGLIPEPECDVLESHLAACGPCRRIAEQFSRLARVSLPEEAPVALVQAARDLFPAGAIASATPVRSLDTVRLLFDASVGRMAFGARRAGSSPRRQLLEIGHLLLDLEISAGPGGRSLLVGQLTPRVDSGRGRDVERVLLRRQDGQCCAELVPDAQGQFQIEAELSPGMKLAIHRGDATDPLEVELPQPPPR
jgi:hypothetical protein